MLDSNERLEFVGDRVLALVMAEWLAERFPQEREGDLGKRLAVLVAQDAMARDRRHARHRRGAARHAE
jgi:ribonuclease III